MFSGTAWVNVSEAGACEMKEADLARVCTLVLLLWRSGPQHGAHHDEAALAPTLSFPHPLPLCAQVSISHVTNAIVLTHPV